MEAELRNGIAALWRELRAGDIVAAEVGRGFAGDDPLHPDLRMVIDGLLQRLEVIAEDMEEFAGPVTLAEPGETELEDIRELVLREPD